MPQRQRPGRHPVPPDAQPCIWMSAGLLSYKLCDRSFDCERCPFDAAIRGESRARPPTESSAIRRCEASEAPEDRLYATGHTWVLIQTAGELRLGIDALAAQLIDTVRAVLGPKRGAVLARGDPLCLIETESGELTIRAPCAGEVLAGNPALRREPRLLLRSPYEEGWLAELAVEPSADGTPPAGFFAAAEARARVKLDLQRFRRQVALRLLAQEAAVGPTLSDGGERLTSLARMLGAREYVDIVQELLS